MKFNDQRRLFFVILSVIVLLLLVAGGCSVTREASVEEPAEDELKICTSFYPIYIMALNVTKGIDGVNLVNIASPDTGCLHDVSLSPADLKKMETTDIFIINGSGMEGYMTKVIGNFPNLRIIDSGSSLDLHQLDEKDIHDNHDSSEVNPHTWVSIRLAIEQVKNVGEQLSQSDPGHKEQYRKNTEQYVAELEALRNKMHKELEGIENRDIITFHEAFPYFADEFDLNIKAVVQREPGSEPSPKELAETIELIKENSVKAIFVEPQYPDGAAQTIARETEAKVYTLDPAVTGQFTEDAYIKAMEKNLLVLLEALKG